MFTRFSILLLFSIGFLWTGHAKLHANELISSSTFTDTNQKSSLDSLSFLQERISAQFITRYLRDSNIFLQNNDTEANILNSSVLLGIKGGGLPTDPGLSYNAFYKGNYFSSQTDEFEYDAPADHNFLTGVELRGAFTKISLDASFEDYGGFARSASFDGGASLVGESRNFGYKKKKLELGLTRELSSSNLQFGFSIDEYEHQISEIFTGSSVGIDRERVAADLSWFYNPTFLAKTSLGLGVTTGQEEISQSFLGSQNFIAPTLRAKWSYSPKTALAGWFGFDERWRDSDDFGKTTSVYGLRGFWTAPTDTKLSVDITKQVYPSVLELDNNVATKRFSIGASQAFNRGISLDLRFFYEFSDYKPTNTGGSRSQYEDLKSFRVSLGKSMEINYFEESQISIFYNYHTNDSTNDDYKYDRDILGLQFKFLL